MESVETFTDDEFEPTVQDYDLKICVRYFYLGAVVEKIKKVDFIWHRSKKLSFRFLGKVYDIPYIPIWDSQIRAGFSSKLESGMKERANYFIIWKTGLTIDIWIIWFFILS